MDPTRFDDLLNAFAAEMMENGELSENSSDQYKSYLRNLRDALNQVNGRDWLENRLDVEFDAENNIIRKCYTPNGYGEIIDAIRTRKKAPVANKRQWGNWLSAFHKLDAFFSGTEDSEFDVVFPAKSPKTYPEPVNSVDGLSDRELMTRFRGRLRTQQRYYEFEMNGKNVGVIIPARAISKIARNRMWWTKTDAICTSLETMAVLVEMDKKIHSVEFKDIERIEAWSDHTFRATLKDGGGQGLVMTAICESNSEMPLLWDEKGGRSIWASLSIDHKRPLHDIVRDLLRKDGLPGLLQLDSLFEIHADKKGNSDPKSARRAQNKGFEKWCAESMDDTLRKQVENDFISLFTADGAMFEIIECRENSKKSDKQQGKSW
ncbi:MAG: hypothetical protein MR051_06215 [Lentisphaeria bacterium]|nr:hypothetical protein [Lentisphaeria bacterium]